MGNNISVVGENGKKYDSYREACRDGDFVAAHKFLDKLKEEIHNSASYYKYQEAEDYIFNYEVNALISQNSEEANARVIYLLNEIPIEGTRSPIGEREPGGSRYGICCNRFNVKLNQILELSISIGNQDIAKKIMPLYKEDEQLGGEFHDTVLGYTYDSKEAAQEKYNEAFGTKEDEIIEEVKTTPKDTKKKRRR